MESSSPNQQTVEPAAPEGPRARKRMLEENFFSKGGNDQTPQRQKRKERIHISEQRSFQPYETVSLDTPLFHIIMEPLCLKLIKPCLAWVYRIRWMLEHPMTTCIFPRWMTPATFILPSPLRKLTVGEFILMVPLLVYFVRCYHYTFVSPSVSLSGKMASYSIYLTFMTANKSNSFFSFFLGIPFERMIPLHLVSSMVAVLLGCFHLYVAYVYGGDDDGDSVHAEFGTDPSWGKFLWDGDTNVSGSMLLACMAGSVGLSLIGKIRRLLYNLWLCSHILLAVGVLLTLYLHHVTTAFFVTCWLALDWFTRYALLVGCRNRTTATLRRFGDDPTQRGAHEPAIELSFEKPPLFDYNPGQFVRIAIPALSIWEFHPISISSAPHEERVTLYIRKLGDWTTRLVQLAEQTRQTEIWLEGPYGSLSVDLDNDEHYKTALFVSGGIGVTPCRSIAKSLLYQHIAQGRHLEDVRFVWAVRNVGMVTDIPPLDVDQDYSVHGPWKAQEDDDEDYDDDSSERHPAQVQVEIYCTRGERPNDDEEQQPARLPYNLHYGRPDLDAIFGQVKKTALEKGEHNVAVFGCGPDALISAVQEACQQHSTSVVGCDNGVFFDMHREYFDL